MSLYTLPCVLFAGGKSSRMGQDKSLMPFAGEESMSRYQYKRLKKIFESVYISAKDASKFAHVEAPVIEDSIAQEVFAPTVGFVNIFDTLKGEDAVFVLSVDTPFVNKHIIDQLLKLPRDDYDAIIVRTPGGIHPLCGIYTRSMEKPILSMLEKGDHKLGKLLKSRKVYYLDIQEETALANLNTQEEYKKALKRLKHQ